MNLRSLQPPYVHIAATNPKRFYEYVTYETNRELAIRIVRGNKMRCLSDLYNELSSALQFPYYFGENWDALDECLTDLEWLHASGYVLAILHARDLLAAEDAIQLETFLHVLLRASTSFAQGTNPKPFHVLLHCEEADVGVLRARLGLKQGQVQLADL